jgi:hypothetical protein
MLDLSLSIYSSLAHALLYTFAKQKTKTRIKNNHYMTKERDPWEKKSKKI